VKIAALVCVYSVLAAVMAAALFFPNLWLIVVSVALIFMGWIALLWAIACTHEHTIVTPLEAWAEFLESMNEW
jgi:hypothetical protein